MSRPPHIIPTVIWLYLLFFCSCSSHPTRSLLIPKQLSIGFDTIITYPSGSQAAYFIIHNETDSGFSFSAYSKGNRKGRIEASPLYYLECKENEQWRDYGPLWCGNELSAFTVNAGEHLYFKVDLPESTPEAIKTAVMVSALDDPDRIPRKIWSDVLHLK